MIAFNERMTVRIEQLPGHRSPQPLPLDSGFSTGRRYRVLGMHSPSETAEAYLILCNDRDELWFISNRHCRFAGLLAENDTPGPLDIGGVDHTARASVPFTETLTNGHLREVG